MPKLADRDTRHAQIIGAVLRVAGGKGLHAVTMRSVAAEADVSLRLVQHYFGTKDKLLLAALHHLAERKRDRITSRLDAAGQDDPRTVIETVLTEALPTDEDSRTLHLVFTAYAVNAVTDPTLAVQPFLRAPDAMEDFIADQLTRARHNGHLPENLDPRIEATLLLAISAGLSTSVLLGQRTPADATAAITYHLDRLNLPVRDSSTPPDNGSPPHPAT